MMPLSGVDIGRKEAAAVRRVLRSGRLALGPEATAFEREVARYVGVRYAVAVSSGTAGLHLVVRALGLGRGDEVITTPFSFVASANCLLYEGVRPVFADIEPDFLNIDPARVEERVTGRTRAILGVDVFGHPADWDGLRGIAQRHGLALIEDSCEALGAGIERGLETSTKNRKSKAADVRRCGSFGDAAVFAFYPNKQITTGEGGMVLTNHRQVAAQCRNMANQGRRSAGTRWLEHVCLGYNYRMDEMSAALGRAQLSRIETILRRRRRVAGWYKELLDGVAGLRVPSAAPGTEVSWFVYVVRLEERFSERDRDRILAGLGRSGIECSNYFRPIHLQPFYQRSLMFRRGDFPVAESVGDRTIALPFFGKMRYEQVRVVADTLRKLVMGKG